MQNKDQKQKWKEYCERELVGVTAVLKEEGFVLEKKQVHIEGERYLMSGRKLVLLATDSKSGKRVVIKVSSERDGMREIEAEREARETLRTLRFAYHTLASPEEIFYTKEGGRVIFVTAYIEQDKNFLARPTPEQFSLALQALKMQEGIHATTYSHTRTIKNIFGMWGARNYLDSFAAFCITAATNDASNHALADILLRAQKLLEKKKGNIEQYCGFLTHTDFVPHNLRVAGNTMYLLDYASLRFGNKYESWARFLNFMLLHNRPLEQALLQYVRDNRAEEEYLSLRLMRVYKLGQLLEYHAGTLSKTEGDLHKLSKKRVAFWTEVLLSVIDDKPLPQEVISGYQKNRDSLRSEEEKQRQKELH